eukprot:gene17305-8883_t
MGEMLGNESVQRIHRVALWLRDVAVVSYRSRDSCQESFGSRGSEDRHKNASNGEKILTSESESDFARSSYENGYLHAIGEARTSAGSDGIEAVPHSTNCNQDIINRVDIGDRVQVSCLQQSACADRTSDKVITEAHFGEPKADQLILDVNTLSIKCNGELNRTGEKMDEEDIESEIQDKVSWRSLLRKSEKIVCCSFLSMVLVLVTMCVIIALVSYDHIPSDNNG